MNAIVTDDLTTAQAHLEKVVRRLYADPAAALDAMRHEVQTEGAEAVRKKLERDFTQFGDAAVSVQGPARQRAQRLLRDGWLAVDMERWLTLARSDPHPAPEAEVEQGVRAPEAKAPARPAVEAHRIPRRADPREGLNAEERLAYDQIRAHAEATKRVDRWRAAEARLHAIHDHRMNLAAAERNVRPAKLPLRNEVEVAFVDSGKAMREIAAAMRRYGPDQTARRIRSGDLLKEERRRITAEKRRRGVFPQRDRSAEADNLERVAQRIETIGYHEDQLRKWSTFQSQDRPRARGAENVRAALDREEARVLADSGIGRAREQARQNRPLPEHPGAEAGRLARDAQQHLERLPPENRERVMHAARQSGLDRTSVVLSHLQTLQTAARTLREGIEPPGH